MPTLAREAELMQHATWESRDLWRHYPNRRLGRAEVEYLEDQERTYYDNICYTTAFAWRNV